MNRGNQSKGKTSTAATKLIGGQPRKETKSTGKKTE